MIKDGYKEIKIKHQFGEDEEPQNVAIEVDLEDVTQGEPLPEAGGAEAPKVETKQEPREDKRKERAKARIKQLLAREKELEDQLRTERERSEKLAYRSATTHKESQTSLKQRLEANVAMLQKQLTDAIKNGDAEATVVYQDEMINAKMELAQVNADLRDTPEAREPDSRPNQQQPQVPEKAQDWLADHPEFYTDAVFQASVLAVNNQLIRDRFNANTDEFYEELDTRLTKRFPEYFGMEDADSVQLKQDKKPIASDEPEDVKPAQRVRNVEQTVSGSSRPSANSSVSRKVTSVELSPSDIAQAERWGITLEQMARRIAHSQKNKRPDGYVQIAMTKE